MRPAALDAGNAAELSRVQAYLDNLHTLHASFLQVAPNGAVSHGTAWMDRPGRLRLEYDPPSQAVLLAQQGQVSLHDNASGATTSTPLARTPLSLLLAPEILLSGPVTVTGFADQQGALQLTLVDTAHPGQGSLTLVLQDQPLTLKAVALTDARGDTTRLVLTNLQAGVAVPETVF